MLKSCHGRVDIKHTRGMEQKLSKVLKSLANSILGNFFTSFDLIYNIQGSLGNYAKGKEISKMVPKRCRETEIGNNEMYVNFLDIFY